MAVDEVEMPLLEPNLLQPYAVPFDGDFSIGDFATSPPDDVASDDELEDELDDLVDELYDLQRVLYADGRYAVLAVFQAMDAAGKDSTIRKVFSGVNPAGFRVNAFGPPSERERQHDFLWRCSKHLPERGRIGIFNRSHYEETLVVRVKPEYLRGQHLPHMDPKTIWSERFESIRNWEKHLAMNGTVVVKFFLNISRDEQKYRFLRRIRRDDKNWKFRLGDLDDRDRWPDFMHAYEEALKATSRPHAPWYAIPADSKDYMRLQVARVMVETLKGLDIHYPKVTDEQRDELEKGKQRLEEESS